MVGLRSCLKVISRVDGWKMSATGRAKRPIVREGWPGRTANCMENQCGYVTEPKLLTHQLRGGLFLLRRHRHDQCYRFVKGKGAIMLVLYANQGLIRC